MQNGLLHVPMSSSVQMNRKQYQKMMFIMSALNNGWKINKHNDSYIFTKKHEGKKEVFSDDYLECFVETNI